LYGDGICLHRQVATAIDHAYFDANDRGALIQDQGPAVTATIANAYIRAGANPAPNANTIDVGTAASLALGPALIHGTTVPVISTNPMCTLRTHDLTIKGGGIGFYMRRAVGRAVLDRTRLENVISVGVQIGGSETRIRDLTIDGVIGSNARAILIPRTASVTIERFAITHAAGAAIDLEDEIATADTRPLLMEGDLFRNQTALLLEAPLMDLRRLMLHVRAHDNDRPRGQ
jgi:hypothetical protein